jgi:division protein 1
MTTGQCVMTMDILWALSHPPSAATSFSAMATPAFSDGSWDMYDDFVGGVQSWGYALVSGSGDGAVRMWDSKLKLMFNGCSWLNAMSSADGPKP